MEDTCFEYFDLNRTKLSSDIICKTCNENLKSIGHKCYILNKLRFDSNKKKWKDVFNKNVQAYKNLLIYSSKPPENINFFESFIQNKFIIEIFESDDECDFYDFDENSTFETEVDEMLF